MRKLNLHISLTIILCFIIILCSIYNNSLSVLFYVNIVHLTLISIGALFFLSIQYASNAIWAKNILKIILSISSFMPIGGGLIIFLLISNCFGFVSINKYFQLHTYKIHTQPYDNIIQKIILNPYLYIIRNTLYIIIITKFISHFKNIQKKDIKIPIINYSKESYDRSIIFLICFYIISTLIAWDWVMFINIHWNSSIFAWYLLSSYLIVSISIITLLYILNRKNIPIKSHNNIQLINLSKYIFAGSLMWGYLWLSQFLLLWYSNIPEEILYFIKRYKYNNILIIILFMNILIPFLMLIKKKNKYNINIIIIVSVSIIIGHYLNIHYMILPEINTHYNIWQVLLSIIITNTLFYITIKHEIKEIYKN